MSYYSDYEGYKPSYYENDNDDVPILSCQRNASSVCYQDNRMHHDLSRTWNEETLVTQEVEQPGMSNLERLLKEAIEQTERHSREWDEIFDWNFEPNYEKPYDTFSNANEHVDDIEAIGVYEFESNLYVPYTSNFVFQDDSDDEMDEEDKDESTNHPHEISQVVLQDSPTLEPELMEASDLDSEDLDYSDSDVEEEGMEEEVEDILVMSDFEVADLTATSPIMEEHELYVLDHDSHGVASSIKVDNVDYDADVKELQKLMGISDHELDDLVEKGVGDDLFSYAEVENLYRASSAKVQPKITGDDLDELQGNRLSMVQVSPNLKGGSKLSRVDDRICTMSPIKESQSGLLSNSLPCNCDCILLKEPKPPDDSLVESDFSGGIGKSNIVHEPVNRLLEEDMLAMLEGGIGCVHLNYFEEPPDCFWILVEVLFKDVGISSHSHLKVAIIRFIRRPLKEWRVYVHVLSFSLRMFYRNYKTKVDILPCEYDEKGSGSECEELAVYPKDK